MANTNDIAGYSAYLKSQGVPDTDIQGYTKYLADAHGVDHPSETKSPDQTRDAQVKQAVGDFEDRESANGKAFVDSLTFGHYPQIAAKVKQIAAGEGWSNDDHYVKRRDAEISQLKVEAEKNPVGNAVNRIGGAVAPMVLSMGGAAPTEVAQAVPFLTRLGKSIIHSAGYGALYGAVQNPGDVEGKVDPLQLKERAEGAKEGAETGAKFGAAIPLAAEAIARAPGVGRVAAQKIGKIFTPVSEETTARYLDNPEAINNAPSREDISKRILNLKTDADAQVTKAHDDLQNARQAVTEAKSDTRAGHADEKFSRQGDLHEAENNFREKKQQFKETLQSNNLTQMAGEVQNAVVDLKQKVVEGSKDAYKILENAKGTVSVDPLIESLDKHYQSQFLNGVPKSDEAAQAAKDLRNWQMRLFDMTKKTDGQLSLPQSKQMMQELDGILTYNSKKTAGGFAPATEQALGDLRSTIDKTVKNKVPEYREKMLEVADQAQTLNKANELYGTPEKAIQNLNNIDSEKGQALHVPLLRKIEGHTGKDLNSPVTGYLYNQKVLNTPSMFEDLINNTTEGKALAGAKNRMQELSNPETSRASMDRQLAPHLENLSAAERKAAIAKENAKQYSGITENSVFQKTKALDGANPYGPEQQIKRIDKNNKTNFESDIRNRNAADEFTKADGNGSRKSLVGGAIGAAGALMFSHSPEAVAIATAAGAKIGATADKYSGQAFKKLLDAGRASGRFTDSVYQGLSKISPEKVSNDLLRYGAMSKGPQKWAVSGFGNLMEHADEDERASIDGSFDKLVKTKKGRDLLINASETKPGSKAMDAILKQVKSEVVTGND